MQTVSLGGSPLTVSRLAYGCWRLTAEGVDGPRAVRAAVEAGFTLFDHADIYGAGVCEEVFGGVMKESPEMRDRLRIASKCGIRLPHLGGAGEPYRYDSRADHIVASCEDSLRRLHVEKIDLYQIHRPDFLTHPQEVAHAFDALARAGKVQEFGVSNFQPGQVAALQRACPMRLRVNQVEFSILQRAPLRDGVLDQCLAENMTPLAWSPLGGGQLADGAGDLLRSQREYQPQRVLPLLDEIASRHSVSRSGIALAWLLKHPARVVPIIGTTNEARIADAVRAESIEL
ncbi:MAG: aldo/keto reductase, partial [Chthoniobacteraceae bacterium]